MLNAVRLWLPIVICGSAVVLMGLRGFDETSLEGGGALIGAGLSVALLNVFFRIGVEGDKLRDEEDDARAFFAEHGRWPDDPAPPAVPHASGPSQRRPSGRPPRRPS
jgi:hypothetical protein